MSEQSVNVGDAAQFGAAAVGAEAETPSAGVPVNRYDALVVGGGIGGLAAAWELTRAGLRPLLIEARGYTGGLVAGGLVAGVRMDLGAEGFVVRGEAITQMVDALGLDIVGPSGGGARLFLPPLEDAVAQADGGTNADAASPASRAGTDAPTGDPARGWRAHRFLRDAFLGIPARPLAADVVEVIGAEGAARAARDAELDGAVGTSPQDPADLASFVRTRMGEAVLDRLVRPIVAGIHTADPADLAADTVAPGLREATARLGSLQAAVGELLERRRARRRGGGAADVTVAGGLFRLTDSLREAIEAAGGEVLTRTGAQWLRPAATTDASDTGGATDTAPGWEVGIAPTSRGATPSAEPVAAGPERVVRTPRVVLACSAGAALRLLAGAPGVDTRVQVPVGSPIARFMLVARAPELSGAPVGSGLLVAPFAPGRAPVGAKALSHLSVKWPWIGEQLCRLHGADGTGSPGCEVHALRLSYGRPGQPRPQVELADALADVEALTGVRIREQDVLDSMLVRWYGTLPPVTPAYRERTRRLLTQVEPLEGLAVTGAWVAGTGIAAVVAHAREQAAGLAGGPAASLGDQTRPAGTPALPDVSPAPGRTDGASGVVTPEGRV